MANKICILLPCLVMMILLLLVEFKAIKAEVPAAEPKSPNSFNKVSKRVVSAAEPKPPDSFNMAINTDVSAAEPKPPNSFNMATDTEVSAAEPQPPNSFNMHGTTQGSLQPQECAPHCTTRCSATAYKKPCMFFCQKCCAKCLCVPPGTYGNKQFCPCYNNWKTKRGGPKCP